MVKRLLALLVAVVLLTSWFAVPVFASAPVMDSGPFLFSMRAVNPIQDVFAVTEVTDLLPYYYDTVNPLDPWVVVGGSDGSYRLAWQQENIYFRLGSAGTGANMPYGFVSGGVYDFVFESSAPSAYVPEALVFLDGAGSALVLTDFDILESEYLGGVWRCYIRFTAPDDCILTNFRVSVSPVHASVSDISRNVSKITVQPVAYPLGAGISSGFSFYSGSMTGSKTGGQISASFGEQPAGNYLIQVLHKTDDCMIYTNLQYAGRYLPSETSGGVTTAAVTHTGGELSISGFFYGYRAKDYYTTAGSSYVTGWVDGEGSVSGSVTGGGYTVGKVTGSGLVTGSGGYISGSSSVTGDIEGESEVTGSVSGSSWVDGSVEGKGSLTVESSGTWALTITDIVAYPVLSAPVQAYGVFGSLISWLDSKLDSVMDAFRFELRASEERTDQKLSEAAKPSTDQAIQTSEDKVDEYDEVSEGYNTQADAALADVQLDAISVPSDFTGAADLLGYVFLNAFQANTMLQFLVIINLAFALVTVIIRR